MRRRYHSEFVDYQVLTIIKNNPGLSMRGILRQCRKDIPMRIWTIGGIQAAVDRLEKRGRIKSERVVKTMEIESRLVYPLEA